MLRGTLPMITRNLWCELQNYRLATQAVPCFWCSYVLIYIGDITLQHQVGMNIIGCHKNVHIYDILPISLTCLMSGPQLKFTQPRYNQMILLQVFYRTIQPVCSYMYIGWTDSIVFKTRIQFLVSFRYCRIHHCRQRYKLNVISLL